MDENVLCLPSTNTLKKVTRRLNSITAVDNSAYLQLRVSQLNEPERTVTLMIDEIYIAKRVEYTAGGVQGLTAESSVASTLLCFMVKSLANKYKDIVAIYPMDKLTAVKLFDCYREVMSLLRRTAMNVVAILVDNAATNRKFFTDYLCSGNLASSILDPVTGQPVFLIFDPVHTMKNVYNNFQSRKQFECPAMALNLPNGCTADFSHIVDLFQLESTMSLKKAHRLTPATLQPRSIEKTSVKLAVSVFCESTRDALQYYATHEDRPAWATTADFITLLLKLWNILNVKTKTKGKHKRDYTMDPVRSSMDWKLAFLREFATFLEEWETSGKRGLSKETFLALRHTCRALSDCASFLLDRRGFQYVLLGHLQSDAIESRFGWLRQLAGANYYISMRQVMEGEKKIRALSLVKFSHFSLPDLDAIIPPDLPPTTSSVDTVADSLAEAVRFTVCPSPSDANIIFYVSGAIARSVIRSTKCNSCRDSLIDPNGLTTLELDAALDLDTGDSSVSTFLDTINRGGLTRPSDYTFMLCVHCWRVFEEMRTNQVLMMKFLAATCHRLLFVKVIDRLTSSDMCTEDMIGDNFCCKGHDLRRFVVQRFFNCVGKNLAKHLTYAAAKDSSHQAKRRKIEKLQSTARL